MALSEDITQRKRAEEALQRSEGYLTEAQKLTHTGSWAVRVPQMETCSVRTVKSLPCSLFIFRRLF